MDEKEKKRREAEKEKVRRIVWPVVSYKCQRGEAGFYAEADGF